MTACFIPTYGRTNQARAGQQEGLKDRPVVVVLAAATVAGQVRLTVAPVTHSAPEQTFDAIEMPRSVKRHLGLDNERSWIVVTEINVFVWPGPDVRPAGSDGPLLGAIPDWLFDRVRKALLAHVHGGSLRDVRRD